MNEWDFTFGDAPWEEEIRALQPGNQWDAVHFLTVMEPEEEDALEEALEMLEKKDILLNIDSLSTGTGSGETALRLRQEAELVRQGRLPDGLEENDPLRLYLEEIAQLPALGDAQLLAEKYLQGDESVIPQLTNLMLSRVVEQSFALTNRGVLLMDLIQEGGLGLWQGILSYQGGDFEAHAQRRIRMALHKAITRQARADGVGQKMRTAMEDYRAVDERLLGDLGRNPTPEEIAEELHMTVEETVLVAKMLENARRISRAKQEPEPEEEELAETQAVEDTAYFQMRQRIADLLSNLDELDAKILTLRFGLEAGLPQSAADVARTLGMTPEEVTAREYNALAKLRNQN